MRLTGRYVERLQTVAEYDPDVAAQFLRVVGFLDPPQALMRPKVALRVLAPRRRSSARRGAFGLRRSAPGSLEARHGSPGTGD